MQIYWGYCQNSVKEQLPTNKPVQAINRNRWTSSLTGVEYECKLEGSCNFTADFEDAGGFVIQYNYVTTAPNEKSSYSFGVRYTSIEYEFDPTNFSLDANGRGFNTQFIF